MNRGQASNGCSCNIHCHCIVNVNSQALRHTPTGAVCDICVVVPSKVWLFPSMVCWTAVEAAPKTVGARAYRAPSDSKKNMR